MTNRAEHSEAMRERGPIVSWGGTGMGTIEAERAVERQRISLFNGEAMDHNTNDHEVWMRCFTAAIAAVLGAREAADDSDLESIVKYCGHIADAALDEERTRRPEPPRSGYQTLKPDVIR